MALAGHRGLPAPVDPQLPGSPASRRRGAVAERGVSALERPVRGADCGVLARLRAGYTAGRFVRRRGRVERREPAFLVAVAYQRSGRLAAGRAVWSAEDVPRLDR